LPENPKSGLRVTEAITPHTNVSADGATQARRNSTNRLEDALGITVPEDLAKALGSQFVVTFDGMGPDRSDPRIAAVSNGDRAALHRLADRAGAQLGGGQLTIRTSGQRTILSPSEGYAADVAVGSGLGDTSSFKDAVPDAGKSRMTAYAYIAGILAAFKDEIPAETARQLAPLSAFGASVSAEGHNAHFTVRLTTR
jgi:hypothetical protein